jgi:hypothetical protein
MACLSGGVIWTGAPLAQGPCVDDGSEQKCHSNGILQSDCCLQRVLRLALRLRIPTLPRSSPFSTGAFPFLRPTLAMVAPDRGRVATITLWKN